MPIDSQIERASFGLEFPAKTFTRSGPKMQNPTVAGGFDFG
jgi:hypothetical protein